jgi:hypothetical protein
MVLEPAMLPNLTEGQHGSGRMRHETPADKKIATLQAASNRRWIGMKFP